MPCPSDREITLRDFLVRKSMERAGELIDQKFSLDFEVRIFHRRRAREGTRTPKDCSTRS